MPLIQLTPDLIEETPPEPVQRLLTDAAERIEDFIEGRLDNPIPGFVPSEFDRAWCGLQTVAQRGLAPGRSFCEWGSGFGVVACMAAYLDFDTSGIEIHPELVDAAESLATDHELPVEFICGSYMPMGSEGLADASTSEFAWLETQGADGYEELGLDIDDFDLIYAFPWPGEEEFVHVLFERYAAVGAVLLTYNGVEDLRFQRKVARRR